MAAAMAQPRPHYPPTSAANHTRSGHEQNLHWQDLKRRRCRSTHHPPRGEAAAAAAAAAAGAGRGATRGRAAARPAAGRRALGAEPLPALQ